MLQGATNMRYNIINRKFKHIEKGVIMLGLGRSEIIRLTQDEGLYDNEVALLLGVHRTTVSRERIKHNIPKAYIGNRKDKVSYCNKCGKRFLIRRKEIRAICYECGPLVNGQDLLVKESVKWKKD